MDCIFCDDSKKFYEDKFFYARWDYYPVSPGHALVIPKEHIKSFFDLPHDSWDTLDSMLKGTVDKIEATNLKDLYLHSRTNPNGEIADYDYLHRMLSKIGMGIKPEGYNIGFNEGRWAGQTIDHFHIHVIPRYIDCDNDPTGGIRNILPYGNYKRKNRRKTERRTGCPDLF